MHSIPQVMSNMNVFALSLHFVENVSRKQSRSQFFLCLAAHSSANQLRLIEWWHCICQIVVREMESVSGCPVFTSPILEIFFSYVILLLLDHHQLLIAFCHYRRH